MNRRAGAILAAAVVAGAMGGAIWYGVAGTRPQGADATDAGLVALGRQVYDEHCASCHGANLEGEPDWRQRKPDGMLPAPPHDETGHTWHHSDDVLFDLTKRGPAEAVGGGYRSDMPGFGDVLTDREIWASLAYIKSRWPARVRAAQEQAGQ